MADSPEPTEQTKPCRLLVEVAVLLLLSTMAMTLSWSFKPLGQLHDDACYVVNALAWLGEMPPQPKRVRSLGPSICVVPYLMVSPNNLAGIRLIPSLASLVFLLLFHAVTRRMLGPTVALPLSLCAALSPGFLLNGCNVMGGPFLNLCLWTLLYLRNRAPTPWVVLGLLLAGLMAPLCRGEGVIVVGAFLLAALVKKTGWSMKRVLALWVVVILTLVAISTVSGGGLSYYGGWLKGYFSGKSGVIEYLVLWCKRAQGLLGGTYLFGLLSPNDWNLPVLGAGGLLMTLGLVGWWRLPSQQNLFLKFLVPMLLMALLFWPFPQSRHLLVPWSVMVFLAAHAVPTKWRVGFAYALLAAILGIGGPNFVTAHGRMQPLNRSNAQTMSWLRDNTTPTNTLLVELGCTYGLLARRPASRMANLNSFEEVVVRTQHFPQPYLVVELANATVQDIKGAKVYRPMAVHLPWMEASTLYEKVHSNTSQVVYRYTPRPGFENSLKDYQELMRSNWDSNPELTESAFRVLLAQNPVAEMPFVYTNFAGFQYSQGQTQEATEILEDVLRSFPFATKAIYNLALCDIAEGRKKRAQQLLEEGIKLSKASGDLQMVEQQTQLLSRIL